MTRNGLVLETVRRMTRRRSWGARAAVLVGAAVTVLGVIPSVAAAAAVFRGAHEPRQAVAVLGEGVVWFDEGLVSLQSFSSRARRLGSTPTHDRLTPVVQSSATAVVMLERRVAREPEPESPLTPGPVLGSRFVAVVPPLPPTPIAQGKGIAGGGCERWLPKVEEPSDFVVAGDELVTAGECVRKRTASKGGDVIEIPTSPAEEPVLVTGLNKGGWKVLRWLKGATAPSLAAEGDLLAIGRQISRARLDVSIINVLSGRTRARFVTPDGALSFAAGNRLLLFEPVEEAFPPEGAIGGAVQLELYSLRGRALAALGVDDRLASLEASAMRVLEWTAAGTLTVRNLSDGELRPVIGFHSPGRKLIAYGLRWPELAVVQSTSPVLALPEISCEQGYYGPPTEPFLTVFDLESAEPYVPPIESSLESQRLLGDCPVKLVPK